MTDPHWSAVARDLTVEMTRSASVTNSDGERAFPGVLHAMISRESYFAQCPEQVWLQAIDDDPQGRSNVWAWSRGSGKEVVVLTGHYDVVSASNYGPLEPYAFDPDALLPRLIADLRSSARNDAERRALADLESGDFLPGRGLLDMKAGLAAGLVALYRHAAQSERVGNVVFIAVADEEDRSVGARGAARALGAWALEHDLEIVGVINLDATSDHGDGTDGRAVYHGSVGKLLVCAYCVGTDVHAGYALDGINANFLASEITRRFEHNPVLADRSMNEIGTPPTSLRQTDLKPQYDVTTPARAWACFNVPIHGKTASDVMSDFQREAKIALHNALEVLRDRAESLGRTDSAAHGAGRPLVLSYAELLEVARSAGHANFDADFDRLLRSVDAQADLPTQSVSIINWLWDRSGLLGPAVVLSFGALHYPSTILGEHMPADARLMRVTRAVLEEARSEVSVVERTYFTGISDMSWFGRGDAVQIGVVNANTPSLNARITAPPAHLPTVNLGPWGRDYHQWLERAYMPYTFGQLPELVWRIATRLLKER
jgi:arginine utilization protein RocB